MEILINELSLTGQFQDFDDFKSALIPFMKTMNEFDRNNDIVLKKQDFWSCHIVNSSQTLHDFSNQKSLEITRFKSFFRNFNEPFWESSQKHNVADSYEYNGHNISGSSLAETCERDKVMISFIRDDFSKTVLPIAKNKQNIDVDNLFEETHYIEVAYRKKQISKCDFFARKFKFGLITLLENEYRFARTQEMVHGQAVYKEIETNRWWYLDNLHKDHYEVFDSKGHHLGEANLQGEIDSSKKTDGKKIWI
jgi:hypothetical protein